MYKLTTINIEKIDCPILIRKVAGTNNTNSVDSPNGTQEYRFTNGAELVASSFEEKLMVTGFYEDRQGFYTAVFLGRIYPKIM